MVISSLSERNSVGLVSMVNALFLSTRLMDRIAVVTESGV